MDDVKAAAERYRENHRVLTAMEHPTASPYTHLEVATGAAEMNQDAWNNDAHRLARAYVGEHDPTPVDPEWWQRAFGRPFPDTFSGYSWDRVTVAAAFRTAHGEAVWPFAEDKHCKLPMSALARGWVRTLCRLMGKPLSV